MRYTLITALALLVVLPLPLAADEYSQAQLDAAHAALQPRLEGCPTPSTCAAIYAQIALAERPGGALERVALQGLIGSIGHAKKGLTRVYEEGDAEARRRVFEMYLEHWNVLGRGFDPNLSEKCAVALEGDEPSVRAQVARLIATVPVPGTAHAAIDAASEDPSLTQAAIMSIGVSRSAYAARWVVSQLTHDDERVRGSARYTLYSLGRVAVAPLKEAVAGEDPALRDAALDALLMMADPDDVSMMYGWLEAHGDGSPELRDRVLRALAEIESGLYEGERPAAIPLP